MSKAPVVDPFEILGAVAEGGMGTVYRAVRIDDGATIAIKVLDRTSDEAAARFDREARLLPTLDHPGIVRYVTHGRTANGKPYIAMEWLEGEDLGARLARQGLTAREAVELVRQAAAALGAAHRLGVVHRDVKPSNLFLVAGDPGALKVLDFGVARWTSDVKLTLPGTLAGTPGYMAPEVVRGASDVDARADVFSLGCVLFECLTGRPAFLGDTAVAVLANVLLSEAPALRDFVDVPPELDALCARMLARSPDDRPVDGDDVTHRLDAEAVLEGRRPSPMQPRRTFLTHGERRLLSVVLARSAGTAVAALDADLRRAGAHHATLHDGSVVVVLEAGSAATDLAAKAARIAIRIKGVAPAAAIGVATGRSEIGFLWPASELIDRAAFLVAQATGTAEELVARVDDVTRGLLAGRFALTTDPTGTSLLGERSELRGRRLLGREVPCVGRQREIDLLNEVFSECVDGGGAKAIVITGPPGVGKSRLCHEFLSRLDPASRHAVWIARGESLRAGAALGTLADAVRGALSIEGGDPAALRAAVDDAVARRFPEGGRARVAAGLGSVLGLALDPREEWLLAPLEDPGAVGDLMSLGWDELVRAELDTNALILVIEDAHAADPPSLEYFHRTLRRARDRPLLVLLVARTELVRDNPTLWDDCDVTRLLVGELTAAASAELIHLALGDTITSEATADLVKLAAGNAFYLEEVIRAVAQRRGGELPPTVRAMVQARLEALSTRLRRVLRAASLFGEVFRAEGVAEILGDAGASATHSSLRELEGEELLERRSPAGDRADDTEWAFRHQAVREVAFEMLTDDDRAIAHGLAGDWLARSGAAEPRTIAWHFDQARDPGRALAWWHRAATRALEANELDAVTYCADRARRCGATGRRLGELFLLEAEAARWCGRFPAALDRATLAMDALPERDPAWWTAASELAVAASASAQHDRIGRLAETIDRVLSAHPTAEFPAVLAASRASRNARFCGRFDLAERLDRHLERMAAAPAAQNPLSAARIAEWEAARAHFADDPSGCLAARLRAADAFDRAGDTRASCHNRANAGYDYLAAGRLDEAYALLQRARDEALRFGLANIAASAAHNLGLVLLHSGDREAALRVETEAALAYGEQDNVRMYNASKIYLARIHWAAGRLDEAEREARGAIDNLARYPMILAYAEGVLAGVLLEGGDPRGAFDWAERAYARLASVGKTDEGGALIRLVRAKVWDALGDRRKAADAIREARARLRANAATMVLGDDEASGSEAYLRAIPEHRETMDLARVWSAADPVAER